MPCSVALPPTVWCQGSQSSPTGNCALATSRPLACTALHSMPWVLSTPLGAPVEPDVNRILATVVDCTARRAAATCGPTGVP